MIKMCYTTGYKTFVDYIKEYRKFVSRLIGLFISPFIFSLNLNLFFRNPYYSNEHAYNTWSQR